MLSFGILLVISGSAAHFLEARLEAEVFDDVDIQRFLANYQQPATLA